MTDVDEEELEEEQDPLVKTTSLEEFKSFQTVFY